MDMAAARDDLEAIADRSADVVDRWDTITRDDLCAEVWQLYLLAHAATCAVDAARNPASFRSPAPGTGKDPR